MVIKPHVPNAERVGINNAVRSMQLAGRISDANSQLNRVITAASGADWRTLRELEKLMSQMFPGEGDTQAAISARLREINPVRHGLVKQVKIVRNDDSGKRVWFYRLVPTTQGGMQ
ncbi:hypothetical protein BZ17_689 [Yersinia pseudotuberculosis IP 32953]|uniref:Uncharacterized protein n=2 Tax=Yersinia pseudotuberculosis complex TaxID=1649845 RepID=Q66BH5_YERPS|nr:MULTISPECIES: hypothetical protein [Yersinia pseudotuberculosis complex]AHK20986.1 hypothetical protein BF17_18125 [Yersinia similis]AJJ57179.1 hypothetical protein BZ17_689 [Yersinia pseudotuberculosis IP 32953]CAH21035.1 hypothetical protein YPTB1796 [Yersinia pseudotuberculosis IP 32953]CFQ49119.1 Uncharacterised protein [Yersinia similis]CND87099.1 Uncharacterised protein [Yersinia pseudotuberculosis]